MLQFTTDDLRPEDRFAHWCEVRGKGLFGVTIELERERRADFQGRFAARMVGGAVMSQMHASSYRISRTAADIARMPGNSLCISHQVRGAGWLDVGRHPQQHIGDGAMVISHSDLPYSGTPSGANGFEYQLLKIPLSDELRLGVRADDLTAAVLPVSAQVARPLSALFRAFARGDALLSPGSDVAHVARLALMARGRLPMGTPEARAALRVGLLHAAREILMRDLGRPALSPEGVARELGISLRQLHVVFEPTGLSFSRTLAALRARAAAQLLRHEGQSGVAQIAFACGFVSLSAFYRAFQETHGVPPQAVRRGGDSAHGRAAREDGLRRAPLRSPGGPSTSRP